MKPFGLVHNQHVWPQKDCNTRETKGKYGIQSSNFGAILWKVVQKIDEIVYLLSTMIFQPQTWLPLAED